MATSKIKNNIKTALVIADIHLNKNNRIVDTKAILRQIALFAINNKVNFVYILGDIYTRSRPYNSEKALFEKFVKYLSDHNIRIIIISGNHDLDSDMVSAVEEFKILELPNITLKSNPCLVTLGKFKIFLGHMLIQGAKLGPVDYKVGSPISIKSILSNWKADLYCFGDVHKAQKLNDNPPMLYVGSPERIDFGERTEKKGFTLIEANTNKLEYKFIPLNIRPMIQFDVEYLELDAFVNHTGDWCKQPETTEAIIKVKISCTKEEYSQIDESEIRKHLKRAKQVFIEYDIVKKARIRSKRIKESSSPVKAFEYYAKINEFDQETITLGLKIMEKTIC